MTVDCAELSGYRKKYWEFEVGWGKVLWMNFEQETLKDFDS
jgi:hypothetical protein